MAFWVYVPRCNDGSDYTGHTDDLDWWLAEHQRGGHCDFASRRRPVALMWSDHFQTRLETLDSDRRIKSWSRAKNEALFQGDWQAVSRSARPPAERPPLGREGER
ncbi:GIY-YIG nuclease family protein [Edaphosphingomonas haloaromaticamans]|uniref:GIY-YIG nuclease superfamily protein n=1 Tax=Edaphosphingomonas haloaromaticamans TaxID=653954 RepID=A0A1S1HGC4_9SPHN|nr:GIY-YIG nuclease family protein [Sphingomonas haloaromaticamans]OHT20263.1 GIY-YIG nuclease superfamily protein [Sphingomonas haloaromaticamans]